MDAEKIKEKLLIDHILNGEEVALRRFWKLFATKVFAFIQTKVSNTADAEEILQDTLLGGLEKLRDFEGRSSLSTFLCAIARHKVIDYYRRKKVKQVVFSQLPEDVLPILSAFLLPEAEFDAKEVRQRIQKGFQNIAPRYQRILTMKYIEGRSVIEIAQSLSVTFKSAESLLFRARTAFVQVYKIV